MNFIKYFLFYIFVLTEGSTCFCFKILLKIFQLHDLFGCDLQLFIPTQQRREMHV